MCKYAHDCRTRKESSLFYFILSSEVEETTVPANSFAVVEEMSKFVNGKLLKKTINVVDSMHMDKEKNKCVREVEER